MVRAEIAASLYLWGRSPTVRRLLTSASRAVCSSHAGATEYSLELDTIDTPGGIVITESMNTPTGIKSEAKDLHMCRPVNCKVCGKTTWAGSGQHVQAVKVSVPAGEWCGGKHSAADTAAAKSTSGGFFSRLFGR